MMNSLVPPSPPDTITTSTFAVSTMASALSTAECTTSNFPFARPSRWALELSVNSNSSRMPCLAKKPFSTPTKNGSERAVGKVFSRTRSGAFKFWAWAEPAMRSRAAAMATRVRFTAMGLGWRWGWFQDRHGRGPNPGPGPTLADPNVEFEGAEIENETGLFHDAGASDPPSLGRDAAGGPRGDH